MMHRLLTSTLLALCLALTGLAAVVAETRMAAAGGYCGTGAPRILLDQAGLPLLDVEGEAIAAPECGICHLTFALAVPQASPTPGATLKAAPTRVASAVHIPPSHGSDRHARAPPRAA